MIFVTKAYVAEKSGAKFRYYQIILENVGCMTT